MTRYYGFGGGTDVDLSSLGTASTRDTGIADGQIPLVEDLKAILSGIDAPNMLNGIMLTAGEYLDDNGVVNTFAGYNYTDYIAVEPLKEYIVSLAGQFVGVFYNSDKAIIGSIPAAKPQGESNYKFTSPAGALYLRINISNEDLVKVLKEVNYKVLLDSIAKSAWRGKKIAWYGTSIPAGYPQQSNQDVYSHANLAVHDLGAEIINKSVPAGGISLTTSLSFVRLTDAINYQNSLVDLIGTAQNPDLVVFDYGVNDYDQSKADIDAFDPNDPLDSAATGSKTKIDTRNKSTFIGAYNTVIDAMLTKNPSINFCFVTHFSNDNANPGIAKKAEFFVQMNATIEGLAKYWGAPVLRLHTKTNYRNRNGFNSITPAMPDHIHPASGDGKSVESLRNIMRDFLISIG